MACDHLLLIYNHVEGKDQLVASVIEESASQVANSLLQPNSFGFTPKVAVKPNETSFDFSSLSAGTPATSALLWSTDVVPPARVPRCALP